MPAVEMTEGDLESRRAVARALEGVDRVVVAASAFTRGQIRKMGAIETYLHSSDLDGTVLGAPPASQGT